MPKIEKIPDEGTGLLPLRVIRRDSRIVRGKNKDPSIRVKCGCCKQAVEIYHDGEAPKDERSTHLLTLEINGVYGTIYQWRKLLLPILGTFPAPSSGQRAPPKKIRPNRRA